MIDPKIIRENPKRVKKNFIERYGESKAGIIDQWLEIDAQRLNTLQKQEEINKEKNALAELGKDPSKIEEVRNKARLLKEQGEEFSKILEEQNRKWNEMIHQIPNFHLDDVPVGKDDKENKVERVVGEKTVFDFTPLDHLTLGTKLGILDFESGAKVAGSQFYYLKGDGVRLEYALIQFALDFFTSKGYGLVMTPDLAKSRYYLGTGYMPKGDEAQIYEIEGEDLGLIGSAEITMAGMHADEVLELDKPIRYGAISHCFRKESGAYGKYSKGLYRVHQFTKFELFIYCKPEESEKMHREILSLEEEILQLLKIPYHVLLMCTGDLGAMAAKKYDLEAWMPGRGDYGEVTSTSNCTDFQARNLNIKYRNKEGKLEYVHMLNGTAVVLSRFPVAIIENYQQSDGTIKIPDVLVKYMGGKEYIGK